MQTVPINIETEEIRTYRDNKDLIIILWDTANIVQKGKVLVRDKEGHHEVDIGWVLKDTKGAL